VAARSEIVEIAAADDGTIEQARHLIEQSVFRMGSEVPSLTCGSSSDKRRWHDTVSRGHVF
jgi:hypothetical protein